MKLKIKILSAVLAGYFMLMSGFISIANAAWDLRDYVTYIGYTNQSIDVSWAATMYADSYEIRLHHVEKDVYVDRGSTIETTTSISLPRTGHYIVEIRAINDVGNSDWSLSTNASNSLVNGVPKGWWIYGYLAPVGPITIGMLENEKGEA